MIGSEHNLLNEISVLRNKKSFLEKDIKQAGRHLSEMQGSIKSSTAEIERLGGMLDFLRAEESKIKKEIESAQRQINKEKDSLKAQAVELDSKRAAAVEKVMEMNRLWASMETIKAAAKEAQRNAAADRDEANRLNQDLDLKNKAFAVKEANLLKRHESFQDSLDKKLKDLAVLKDEVATEKAGILNDWKILKDKDAAIQVKDNDLKTREKKLAEGIQAVESKETDIIEREEALNIERILLDSERKELLNERKKTELERLRVEKLAKEKEVDKELKKLRAELEGK